MTACLSDFTLWALSEGDGTTTEREHVRECGLCAHRARHLEDDLTLIRRTLRTREPAPAASAPIGAGAWTWALAGSAVVAALLVSLTLSPKERRASVVASGDGVTALAALSRSVFADDEGSIAPATDLDVVATAFDVAGPCEWQPGGCGDENEPLY